MHNLETRTTYSAKNLSMAVGAVTFTSQEEIELPGRLNLWQHLVPYIRDSNEKGSKTKGKSPPDGFKFLLICKSHTIQPIAYLQFMIPIVQKIIQLRNMVQFTLDTKFHKFCILSVWWKLSNFVVCVVCVVVKLSSGK
jgi:hypothetical protein